METEAETAETVAESTVEAELADAKALAEERYKELQYARAEIDNVRKRAERIASDRLSAGRRSLLGKFLPVIDNLQRALGYEDSGELRGGLQATLKGFEALLASEGVRAIDVVGKPFDPRIAEAIATREASDGEDDLIVDEAQRGYMLGDELLRPAQVVVSKRVD